MRLPFVPNSTDNAKNVKRNVSQTREKHSLEALTTFNNISKSNHNDTYHENSRKIQRKIRHYTNSSQLRETNIVFSAMRLAEHSFCGARCPTAIRLYLDGPKKCRVFLRNQTARHSIYNRANSGMQSRDSLRDSPEMHCKISSSKNKQERMNCRKNENILRNKQIQQNSKYEWHNNRGKH